MRPRRRQTGLPNASRRPAFTLVELVIVVVIIGIIAAVALPRFSGMDRRNKRAAVTADLTVVRGAIDLYYAEHGRYPGYNPANGVPDGTWFVKQLINYSDDAGEINGSRVFPYVFGPYLRPPFPTNPLNAQATVRVIPNAGSGIPAADTSGWFAVLETGQFTINTSAATVAVDAIDQAAVEAAK